MSLGELLSNSSSSPTHVLQRSEIQVNVSDADDTVCADGKAIASSIYDNDDSSFVETEKEPLLRKSEPARQASNAPWLTWQMIRELTKAVLAFSIAMCYTFEESFKPYVGEFGYLSAVTILFFHPSKSVGAMVEAVFLGLLGMAFGTLLSLAGLYLTFRMANPSEFFLSVCLMVSMIFCGVFLLAYIRARSSKPPVYTGISISQMLIFITLMGNHPDNIGHWNTSRVFNIVTAILFGTSVSLVTNVLFWPKSASIELRKEMIKSLNSVNEIMSMLVRGFLLEENVESYDVEFLMTQNRILFSELTKTNAEAKLEFISSFLFFKNSSYQPLISSINRLNQHIGGMKSSLLREEKLLNRASFSKDSDMLVHFIENIGPSIRDLADVCNHVIKKVGEISSLPFASYCFGRKNLEKKISDEINDLHDYVSRALIDFEQTQKEKLMILYESERFDGTPNDELFVIYFFVFNMVEFAKEIRTGLLNGLRKLRKIKNFDELDKPKEDVQVLASEFVYEDKISPRSSNPDERNAQDKFYEYLQSQTNDQYRNYLKSPNLTHGRTISQASSRRRGSTTIREKETDLERNIDAENIEPPIHISAFLRYRLWMWRFLSDIGRSFELKFAFKSALLVTSIAIFAFLPETMAIFSDFRVHWLLISITVIMSPTVGGTNSSGLLRLFGTFSGVAYSYFLLHFFGKNIYLSWFMLAIFSIPCFFLLLFSGYPRVGQVSLVSVTSITLSYFCNTKRWNLFELAWKQGLMVSLGIILGLLVTWYVWPYEARVELRKGLSDLLLNMGILYSRLVEVFNPVTEVGPRESMVNEENIFTRKDLKITPDTLHMHYYAHFEELSTKDTLSYFLAFELKVHMDLMKLESLLPLTWLEPRLKGPFPVDVYRHMLKSCQNILDKFVAMRVAISNNVSLTEEFSYMESQIKKIHPGKNLYGSHEDLILGLAPTSFDNNDSNLNVDVDYLQRNKELFPYRRDLVGSVLLCFYIYAGSLILKQPLPTYLPQAKEARARLMKRIRQIIKDSNSSLDTSSSSQSKPTQKHLGILKSPRKYINYYAYSLAMEDVILELERLGIFLKCLFGEMFSDVLSLEETYDSSHPAPLKRSDSTVSLSFEEHKNFLDTERARKRETRIELETNSPVAIPLLHHNRADRWGSIREKALQNPFSPPSHKKRSTAIFTNMANSPLASHAGIRNKQSVDTMEPSNDDAKVDEQEKAEWWRASGNWMI